MSDLINQDPENTERLRDTINSLDSSDGCGVINRGEEHPEINVSSLTGATFKGKKAYLVKNFINSDRISNRHLNALGIVGYLIQIEHEGKRWSIYKRRKEFGNFHDNVVAELNKKDAKLGISMPDYKEEEGEAEESMVESMRSHCNYLKSLSLHKEA
jgi:hypothetical protein